MVNLLSANRIMLCLLSKTYLHSCGVIYYSETCVESLVLQSNLSLVRLPAEFKHIIKRRKRK
jgi:hypothetical protein